MNPPLFRGPVITSDGRKRGGKTNASQAQRGPRRVGVANAQHPAARPPSLLWRSNTQWDRRSSRRDCGALYCHHEGAFLSSVVAFLVPRRSQHTGIADDLAHLDRPISHSNYWGIQWHRVTPSRSLTDNSSSRRCVGATVATLRSRLCTLLSVLSVALMSSLTSANGFDVIACPFG